MSTNILDVAWHEVNALGGVPCCSHDHVYNAAIKDALRVIERLGGRDPLTGPKPRRQAEGRCPDCGGSTLLGCHCFQPSDRRPASPGLRAEDVLPVATLDALQGGDEPGEAA
jgi:hypothetical protein